MTRRYKTLAVAAVAVALSTTLIAQVRPEVALRSAIELEEAKGDIEAAIEQYKKLTENRDRAVAARASLRLANAYQRLGDSQARAVYESIVRNFGEQRDVAAEAEKRLATLAARATQGVQTARRISPSGGYGRPSPDGRYMAYGQCCGTGDLAVRDLTTNTTRQLTNSGGWVKSGDYASAPVISADNQYVAYEWLIEAEGVADLRVIPLTGRGQPRSLVKTTQRYIRPVAWTPDGTRVLVFRGASGDWHIGTVNVGDGRYTRLKSFDWQNPGRIELSPDGRFITYVAESREGDLSRDLVVLAMDGSRETVIVAKTQSAAEPFWSADGAHVIFFRTDAGKKSLWAVAVRDGRSAGTPYLLKEDVTGINALGVTREGALYYATGGGVRQNVYVAPLNNLVAGVPVMVTGAAVDAASGVSWSPDGTLLTYWSTRQQPALILRSMTTGQERTIPLPPGSGATPAPEWFPDGRSVLISMSGSQGAAPAFARFDIETGTVEHLHQSPSTRPAALDLAPDGSAIYWITSNRLMRFDLKTRQEQELKRDEWYLALAVSPDGKELAYLKNTRTASDRVRGEAPGILEIMPAAGGPSRQVFRAPVWYTGTRYNTLAWTPDQRSLLGVRDDFALWRIPVDGTTPQRMGLAGTENLMVAGKAVDAERMIRTPRIHRDGKTIAFTLREEVDPELWRLDNFLAVPNSKR